LRGGPERKKRALIPQNCPAERQIPPAEFFRERKIMKNREKLLDEVFELALYNDMTYRG
jgi:hypothetical protein